ncbi:MAG TPA: 6-carboxytetrahydropterin synthase [Gemmatimonadaceae bacterium]|nr:6-carboxytetrahydropterin synthase [Gemmatimonadaceae bacterium]
MAMVSLTRRVSFRASHRYRRADWSNAKNETVFGPRALQEYHSHSYVCDVTVSGPVNKDTGMIVDLRILDGALRTEVVERLDGRNLNIDVPEFCDGAQIPTGENLATLIASLVQRALDRDGAHVPVTQVTVAEDATLSATWRAGGP